MTNDSKDNDKSVNTNGGAYISGDVHISRGDFVGRDKFEIHQQGATLDEFRKLLAEFDQLLPSAPLTADTATVIDADFEVVKQEVDKESPNGAIIKSKLSSIAELITSGGNTAGALDKIIGVASKLIQIGGSVL